MDKWKKGEFWVIRRPAEDELEVTKVKGIVNTLKDGSGIGIYKLKPGYWFTIMLETGVACALAEDTRKAAIAQVEEHEDNLIEQFEKYRHTDSGKQYKKLISRMSGRQS